MMISAAILCSAHLVATPAFCKDFDGYFLTKTQYATLTNSLIQTQTENNRMKHLIISLTAAAAIVGTRADDASVREAYRALPDSTDELGIERLYGKLPPEDIAQIAALIEAANVLIEDGVKAKEATAAGRQLLHGQIVTQRVDLARSKNVLVYADGWTYEEPFQARRPLTLEERNAQTKQRQTEQARKTAEMRAKTMPPGLVQTMAQRDAAKTSTNTVETVITPEP